MVRQLRGNKGKRGLILANGGLATYQFVLCLSRSPRRDGLPYPTQQPLPELVTDVQVPPVVLQAEGDAIVEVRYYVEMTTTSEVLLTLNRHIQSNTSETTLQRRAL